MTARRRSPDASPTDRPGGLALTPWDVSGDLPTLHLARLPQSPAEAARAAVAYADGNVDSQVGRQRLTSCAYRAIINAADREVRRADVIERLHRTPSTLDSAFTATPIDLESARGASRRAVATPTGDLSGN